MDRPRLIRGLRIAWTLVLGILCVLLVTAAWTIYRDLNPRVHVFSIDPGAVLTEEAAVEYTRRALNAEAKDKPDMHPMVDYLDSNGGRVYWNVGYSVVLERIDGRVTCQVYKYK